MNEAWNVGLQSNFLRVNDQTLRADVLRRAESEKLPVNAEQLERMLKLGRFTILEGIEDFYEKTQAANPTLTVERPSIFTAQLGTTAQTDGRKGRVFTDKGYDNGGIITSIEEIKEPFHGHWNAVKAAGFVPEVRRTSGKEDGGSWLLLRRPTIANVLKDWLDYQESPDAIATRNDIVEKADEDSPELQKQKLRLYRALGSEAIVSMEASNDIDSIRRQYIGLELAMGVLRGFANDWEGSDESYDDALLYARGDERLDENTENVLTYTSSDKNVNPSVAYAIENALW